MLETPGSWVVIRYPGVPDPTQKCWTQADERWRVSVIDTTDASIEQALEMVARWVEAERNRVPVLSPVTKWWE